MGTFGVLLRMRSFTLQLWLRTGFAYMIGFLLSFYILIFFAPFPLFVVGSILSGFAMIVGPLVSLSHIKLKSPLVWLLGLSGGAASYLFRVRFLSYDEGLLIIAGLTSACLGGAIAASTYAERKLVKQSRSTVHGKPKSAGADNNLGSVKA